MLRLLTQQGFQNNENANNEMSSHVVVVAEDIGGVMRIIGGV